MKFKYIALLFLVILITGTISCKKQIDNQNPSAGSPIENIFSSMDGFEEAARGMYRQMVHSEHYLGGSDAFVSWITSMDLMADNLISQTNGRGSQRSYANYILLPSSNIATMDEAYSIIRAANSIIENKDNLEGTENYYGEALTVRAMVHFDLLRLYSKAMTGAYADVNSLGVPYVTSTDISLKPDRGTVKETYEKIVEDLITAVENIGEDNGEGRLNKAAAYGLLSRVYLYGGDWQKCINASNECLALNGADADVNSFPAIWEDATNDGVLFKLKFTPQDNGTDGQLKLGVGYFQVTPDGVKSEWVCTKSLYDLYDSNDVRKSMIQTVPFAGVEYNAVFKYYQKADGTTLGIVDLKYLRVAEIILNRAEAYTMLGNDADALLDLNGLRQNRYFDYEPGEELGQGLKDAIQLQRRLELAFEGDRWFDLKRKGLPVVRDEFGDQADGGGSPSSVSGLAPDDHRWLLPISQFDLQGNSNLTQNPGY